VNAFLSGYIAFVPARLPMEISKKKTRLAQLRAGLTNISECQAAQHKQHELKLAHMDIRMVNWDMREPPFVAPCA